MERLYKYKTEMHCHTAQSSLKCGKMNAEDVVETYINAGYSTLLITVQKVNVICSETIILRELGI